MSAAASRLAARARVKARNSSNASSGTRSSPPWRAWWSRAPSAAAPPSPSRASQADSTPTSSSSGTSPRRISATPPTSRLALTFRRCRRRTRSESRRRMSIVPAGATVLYSSSVMRPSFPERLVAERDQPPADRVEAERERVQAVHGGGESREPELLLDPDREVVPAPALPAARLDDVQVDHRGFDGAEGVAKLRERPHLHSGRDLEQPRLHEVEGLPVHDPRHRAELGEVVVDQAHDLGAETLEVGEVQRVDDAELLPEHPIADLDRRPGGEVVRVRAGERPLAEEAPMGVKVDAVQRDLLEVLEQLALVVRAAAEHLVQLPAAVEMERGHASSTTIASRSRRIASGSPGAVGGRAARHQRSVRICAGARSIRTSVAFTRSRTAIASAAASGRRASRASSARASRGPSHCPGNTAPCRRSALTVSTRPAIESRIGRPSSSSAAAIVSAPRQPRSAASAAGSLTPSRSRGARIGSTRARPASASSAARRASASATRSRCTPKSAPSPKSSPAARQDGVPSAATTTSIATGTTASVARSRTVASPPAIATSKPGTSGAAPSLARSAPDAATRAGVAAAPLAARR